MEIPTLFCACLTRSALPIRNRKSSLCSELVIKYEVEEDVLGLDVAMDYLLLVDVVQTLTNFTNNGRSLGLFHAMAFA